MPIHQKKDWSIAEKDATDEDVYLKRRRILTAMGGGGARGQPSGEAQHLVLEFASGHDLIDESKGKALGCVQLVGQIEELKGLGAAHLLSEQPGQPIVPTEADAGEGGRHEGGVGGDA